MKDSMLKDFMFGSKGTVTFVTKGEDGKTLVLKINDAQNFRVSIDTETIQHRSASRTINQEVVISRTVRFEGEGTEFEVLEEGELDLIEVGGLKLTRRKVIL